MTRSQQTETTMQPSQTRTKRAALGRGLSALIPPRPTGPLPGENLGLMRLPIEKIEPSQQQPRHAFDDAALEELAASIREHGVLQPIVVRRAGQQSYRIVAGERRWRAAQRAGLHEIAAVVSNHDEDEALVVALVENLQREDLNPVEEAEAYRHLSEDYGLSQEQIAERVGKDRTTVANAMRLLKLPSSVLDMVTEGQLSMGHARALLGLSDHSSIERLARATLRKRLSVRDVERRVKLARSQDSERPSRADKRMSPAERDVTERLIRALSTKVVLKPRANGSGTIEIAYNSLDELDRLLVHICG